MASWIIPALKAVLPHVKTIYDTAAPVFTKKKVETVPDPTQLLQQQIAELQEAAQLADHRMRRVTILASVAGALSLCALAVAAIAFLR